MKKFNKWRWVSYSNDGCDIYQCLACRNYWDSRTSPEKTIIESDGTEYSCSGFKFCGFCGTRWESEHKWNNEESQIEIPRSSVEKYWILESRMPVYSDKFSQHGYVSIPFGRIYGAKEILRILKNFRSREHRHEFRVIISDEPENTFIYQECLKEYHENYRKEWGGKNHYSKEERPRGWIKREIYASKM